MTTDAWARLADDQTAHGGLSDAEEGSKGWHSGASKSGESEGCVGDAGTNWTEMMEARMKVYVAGPIAQGDQILNARVALLAGIEIRQHGHLPFVPHAYLFAHYLCPKPYEWWMTFDMDWLSFCDCLVRLPGHSPGSDREVEKAKTLGMPVYFGLDAFLLEHGRQPVPVSQTLREILEV